MFECCLFPFDPDSNCAGVRSLYIPQRDACLVTLAEIEAGHPRIMSPYSEDLQYEITLPRHM
jgi:hypothetical protein